MDDTLQYRVALKLISDPRNTFTADHPVTRLLCSILHVPSPDEPGFDVDVRTTYESMRENGDTPEHLARRCIQKHNVQLTLYYLDLVSDSGTLQRLVGIALGIFSDKSPYMMTELIEKYNILPEISGFYRVYKMKDVSIEFKKSILTVCTIYRYEREARTLIWILNAMISDNDVDMFTLLMDRLLEIPGYRESIQECLRMVFLSLFHHYRDRRWGNIRSFMNDKTVSSNPIPLSFIRVMEERGFEVVCNIQDTDRASIALRSFTHDTEDDRYIWNRMIDQDAVPDRQCLIYAIHNNNYRLVVELVSDGMTPGYGDMLQALDAGYYKISDYLFDVSWRERMDVLRCGNPHTLSEIRGADAMNYFVNVYWRPDEDQIKYILREIYNKNTPNFNGEQEDSVITLLLRAIRENTNVAYLPSAHT